MVRAIVRTDESGEQEITPRCITLSTVCMGDGVAERGAVNPPPH